MTLTTPRGYPYAEYTDPMNPAGNIQALATAVDTDMQTLYDRVNAGKHQPTCYLRAPFTTLQAVAANTNVLATYTTEVVDTDNMANLGTSNTTINITQTGIYLVTGTITLSSPGSPNNGSIGMWLENNGTGGLGLFARSFGFAASTVNTNGLTAAMVIFLQSGSNIQMVMRQTSSVTYQSSSRHLSVTRQSVM
jgi:hypothetical protein